MKYKRFTFLLLTSCLVSLLLLYRLHSPESSTAPGVEVVKDFTATEKPVQNHAFYKDGVEERHLQLQKRCQERYPESVQKRKASMTLPKLSLKSVNLNLVYCPITKAGSTFLTRFITAMHIQHPFRSPLEISVADEKLAKPHVFTLRNELTTKQEFLDKSFKFVFSRHPYWRLFSAYVDKLFSPNTYYWTEWGNTAVRFLGLKEAEHRCGSGVSFKDYVEILLKRKLYHSDIHFIPMSRICDLCNVKYDLVGKAEHAITDIDMLAEKLGVSSSFQHEEGYKMATAVDIINDSTEDVFRAWLPKLKKCVGSYQVGRIIWRRLQIRGVIYSNISFPLSHEEMEYVTMEEFRKICRIAGEKSKDLARLRKQKIDAFVAAYRTLTKPTLKQLQEIYEDDFHLLDYDISPDSIFKSEIEVKSNNIFDWNTEWKEQ